MFRSQLMQYMHQQHGIDTTRNGYQHTAVFGDQILYRCANGVDDRRHYASIL